MYLNSVWSNTKSVLKWEEERGLEVSGGKSGNPEMRLKHIRIREKKKKKSNNEVENIGSTKKKKTYMLNKMNGIFAKKYAHLIYKAEYIKIFTPVGYKSGVH